VLLAAAERDFGARPTVRNTVIPSAAMIAAAR
jgi:hypothetical protein